MLHRELENVLPHNFPTSLLSIAFIKAAPWFVCKAAVLALCTNIEPVVQWQHWLYIPFYYYGCEWTLLIHSNKTLYRWCHPWSSQRSLLNCNSQIQHISEQCGQKIVWDFLTQSLFPYLVSFGAKNFHGTKGHVPMAENNLEKNIFWTLLLQRL